MITDVQLAFDCVAVLKHPEFEELSTKTTARGTVAVRSPSYSEVTRPGQLGESARTGGFMCPFDGDEVVFSYNPETTPMMKFEGEEYFIVRSYDILAITPRSL